MEPQDESEPEGAGGLAGAARPATRQGIIGPFTWRHIISLVVSVLGVAALLVVLTIPVGSPSQMTFTFPAPSAYLLGAPNAGIGIGNRAPELLGADGAPILDLAGQPVTLGGRPVWLTFFATWCPPCREEMPTLRAIQDTMGSDVDLISVSVQEDLGTVADYASTYDLSYTFGLDPSGSAYRDWLGYALPTHYFIDSAGVVRAVHYGPLSVEAAKTLLTAILPAQAPLSGSVEPSSADDEGTGVPSASPH